MSDPNNDHKHGGGPRTEEGKNRVSLNALKHGLSARSPQALSAIAQECESEAAFEEIFSAISDYYCPSDAMERGLVRRIAVSFWRLYRTETVERRYFIKEGRTLPRFSGSGMADDERLPDLYLHRAIRALERKRDREKWKNDKTNSGSRST
jgi:hypothetical protein